MHCLTLDPYHLPLTPAATDQMQPSCPDLPHRVLQRKQKLLQQLWYRQQMIQHPSQVGLHRGSDQVEQWRSCTGGVGMVR